jgi:hypothetical protein
MRFFRRLLHFCRRSRHRRQAFWPCCMIPIFRRMRTNGRGFGLDFSSLSPDEKAESRGFGFALFSVCHRMKRRRAEALALLFPLSVVEAKAEGGNRTHENLLCRQTQCHCATSAFRAFFRMPSTGFEPAAYCFLLSLKGRMGISHLA